MVSDILKMDVTIPQITITGMFDHVKRMDAYNACDVWRRVGNSYAVSCHGAREP